MTQKDRLLELFRARKTLSNYELRSMQPPMFQYPVRIHELIQAGYNIVGHHDKLDKKKYWYTLYEPPAQDLFGHAA